MQAHCAGYPERVAQHAGRTRSRLRVGCAAPPPCPAISWRSHPRSWAQAVRVWHPPTARQAVESRPSRTSIWIYMLPSPGRGHNRMPPRWDSIGPRGARPKTPDRSNHGSTPVSPLTRGYGTTRHSAASPVRGEEGSWSHHAAPVACGVEHLKSRLRSSWSASLASSIAGGPRPPLPRARSVRSVCSPYAISKACSISSAW